MSYRGRGFARLLLDHLLSTLDRRGIRALKLDATEMGQGLYADLGFDVESVVECWVRDPNPVAGPALSALDAVPAEDQSIFGADRSALLGSLLSQDSASLSDKDYALGRHGRLASSFGPCVASSAEAARRMPEWFLALHEGKPVYWDLPAHLDARDLRATSGSGVNAA